jgi:hypothetical protein
MSDTDKIKAEAEAFIDRYFAKLIARSEKDELTAMGKKFQKSLQHIRALLAAVDELQRENRELFEIRNHILHPRIAELEQHLKNGNAAFEVMVEDLARLEQQLIAKDALAEKNLTLWRQQREVLKADIVDKDAEIAERNKIIADKIKTCDDLREERDTLRPALESLLNVADYQERKRIIDGALKALVTKGSRD